MTKLTKNEMARVIVQALFYLPELPASDDARVLRHAKPPVRIVKGRYTTAHAIVTTKVAAGTWPKNPAESAYQAIKDFTRKS